MHRSCLTLGFLLSLGSFGCAGFGVQQGTNLVAENEPQRGLDSLWDQSTEYSERSRDAREAAERAPRYAKQDLGVLWDVQYGDSGITQSEYRGRSADLWTPSSAKVSDEPQRDERRSPSYRFSSAPRNDRAY